MSLKQATQLSQSESKSVYLLEATDRFLTRFAHLSDSELGKYWERSWKLQTVLSELFEEGDIDNVMSELHTLSKSFPYSWRLVKRLLADIEHPDEESLRARSGVVEQPIKSSIESRALASYLEGEFPIRNWYVEIHYASGQNGESGAKLFVTLADEPSQNSSGSFKIRSLGREERIIVGIDGSWPLFESITDPKQESFLSADDHKKTFDFNLLTRIPQGPGEITVRIWLPERQDDAIAAFRKAIKVAPDALDLVMRIWQEGQDLHFSVRFASDLSEAEAGKQPLGRKPEEYFDMVHNYLNRMAASAVQSVDVKGVRDVLEQIGMVLYRDLFTQELVDLYWGRIHGNVRTWLLVVDPSASQIPWELLVPKTDQPQEYEFLCEQFQIGRIIATKGEAVPSLHPWISISPLALVSSDPAGMLDGVKVEREKLKGLANLQVRQVEPKYNHVMSLLQSQTMQNCAGLHLSGDGKYGEGIAGCSFRLLDRPLTEMSMEKPENRMFGQVAPFVFLNFCESGQIGHSLTGFRGWLTQFKEIGASCIIATMWKANDQIAPDFSHKLYERLLAGKSIGEAMQFARQTIKSRGDATWLSYVLYGDPRAKAVQAMKNLKQDRGGQLNERRSK